MALTIQERRSVLALLPDDVAKDYVNGRISDEQLEQIAVRTGVRKSGKTAPKSLDSRNAIDTVGDAAKAGLRRTGAGMVQRGIDADALREREESEPWYQRDVLDFVGFGPDERARADADIASSLQGYKEGETYTDIQRRMEAQAAAEEQRVDRDVKSLDSSVGRTMGRAVTDAAGSPLSYLSVFGGPAGALSGVDSYARTYRDARKAGVSIEEAEKIARERQMLESGIGMIPAAKLLGPLANLGKTGGNFATRAATRIGVNATGEGVNEALTEGVNMAVDAERAIIAKDEAVRAYSKDNLPASVAEGANRLFRTFMAGTVGGGAISAPSSMFEASRKAGSEAMDMMHDEDDDKSTPEDEDDEPSFEQKVRTPVQESLFGELPGNENYDADRQRELETDAGFSVMRRQRAAEEIRQREILGTTQQLDVARQQVEELQDRVQAGEHSNADLSALAAANRRVRGLENMLGQLTQAPEAAPAVDAVQQEAEQLGLPGMDVKQPQQIRREAATTEARGLLQKDQAAIQKAATKKRAEAAKKFNASLLNQARDMKPDEAVEFIATRREEWEVNNPLDVFVSQHKESLLQAEQKRNQKAAGNKPFTQRAGQKTKAPAISAEQLLAQLGPDATVGSQAPVTGVTTKKMILSGGSGADKALKENRTWISADGARKYEISDNESAVIPEGVQAAIASEQPVRAGDVIKHDELFKEFPELADVPVTVLNEPDSPYGGAFVAADAENPLGRIEINVGNDDGDMAAFNSTTHRSLIHELQHAAQHRAGTTTGASVNTFLSPEGKKAADRAGDYRAAINAARELGMPESDIAKLQQEEAEVLDTYWNEWDKAAEEYVKVLGEQEAYSTQDRMPLTFEERQADTLTREQDIINRQGRSLNRQGDVLAQRADQVRTSPGQVPNDFFNGVRDMKTMLLKLVENSDIPSYKELAAVLSASRWAPTVGVMRVQNRADLHPELRREFERGAVGLAAFSADDGQPFLYFDPTREGGVRAEAVVHESIHALTEAALKRNPKIRKDLERIAGNVRAVLVRENMTEALKHWDLGIQNNAGELLAYGLTSPMFRGIFRKLDENGNVPGEKNPSIWQKIADFVFDALAIPARFRPRWNANIGKTQPGRVRPLTSKLNDSLKQLMSDTEEKGTSTHSTIRAFRIQDLTAARERMANPDNKVLRELRKGFSGFGALGRELAALKEMADGFAALRSHNAMNHFHEINRGITAAAKAEVAAGKAKDEKTAESNIRSQVERAMAVMSAEPDKNRRVSIMNALIRRYPSLDGFPRAVQEVNELTRTLVRQMLEANPNPTPDELALYEKMLNNEFGYTTRMFAAFQGAEGRKYSERVRKEYEAAQKALKNGKTVPPKYVDSYNRWKNAANYVINNDLTIPDESEIDGTSTDRLTRLYDTWVGDAARLKAIAKAEALARGSTKQEANQAARDAMISGLLDRAPTINSEEMKGMADNLVLGMLGLQDAGGPFASYYRGFKEDRGILNKREDLPEEIKQLFGEITDPATRLAITIAKQGELAGRTRLLLDMKQHGVGKWIVKAADRGKPGNERFTQQLTGEGFGPINGYYADPDIAAAISDSLEMFSTMGDALAKGYGNSDALAQAIWRRGGDSLARLAGIQKLLTVVADVYNMGMNAFGSPIMLAANGIYNPAQWVGGAKVAAQVIWDTGMQGGVQLSMQTQDAIRYGVLDSARVQEIRKTPQQFVRNLISDRPEVANKAINAWNRGTRTGIEMFAMADAWVKIVAFQERTETLRKFYEAEGIKKTEHELKAEASDQIKDTNITYARTGAVIRGAERLGFTTFMPYFVSVPRAIAYNTTLAFKDMARALDAKTPAGKMALGMAAARRMSGVGLATAGVVYGMKAIAAAINDEDEEKLAEMQKLMFPDARFADAFFLGYDDKNIPMFARFSRIDPFGPVNDFLRILVDDSTEAPEKRRYMMEMFKDMLITNRVLVTGTQLLGDIAVDADVDIAAKEVKLERIGPKTTARIKDWIEGLPGLDHNDSESMIAALDSFTPGIADMFDPNNRGIAKESEDGAAMLGAIITYTGGRMDRADPKLAAYAAGKELEDIRKRGRRRQSDGLKAGESAEVLEARFLEDARDEYDAMRNVAEVWGGMRKGMDLSPRQAAAIMKDDGRLKEPDIRNLHYGQLSIEAEQWIARYSRLLSVDSQRKAALGREDRKLTPEEKQKIREYLRRMKAMGYKVQE